MSSVIGSNSSLALSELICVMIFFDIAFLISMIAFCLTLGSIDLSACRCSSEPCNMFFNPDSLITWFRICSYALITFVSDFGY